MWSRFWGSLYSATVFDKALIDYFRKASQNQEVIVKAIGNAILDAQIKLDKLEVIIKGEELKLETAKNEAKKLLELAMTGTLSQGATVKARMDELDEVILKLEDKLANLQAQRNIAQMSAHSGQFLYSNLRFAMQYLDQAPAEAQKALLRALIKAIVIFEDRIELRMNIGTPAEALPGEVNPVLAEICSINGKSPIKNDEALTDQSLGSSGRPMWLPDYLTKRTVASAKIRFPVYLQFIRQRLVIITGQPPYNIKTDERITRRTLMEAKPKIRKPSPIDQALKYAQALGEPSIVSKNQIAERFGVSRARVCQLLNLLELDYSIIQYITSIENVDEHNFFTERRLRSISLLENKNAQLAEFNRLRQEACREMVLV